MSVNNSVKGSSSIFRFALNLFKKTNLTCRWSVPYAPPATDVQIIVESDTDIDATSAEIFIYQLLGGKEVKIAYFPVPFEEKRYVNYTWRTQPAKGGDYEAGEYHFRVKVNNHTADTTRPLKLKDMIARRNESAWEDGKKELVNLTGGRK